MAANRRKLGLGAVELTASEGSDTVCPSGHRNTTWVVLRRKTTGLVLTTWFECSECNDRYETPSSVQKAWEMYRKRCEPVPTVDHFSIVGSFTPREN